MAYTLTPEGEYISPNRAKSPDFSDPNHDSNHQKRNSLITKILMCYECGQPFSRCTLVMQRMFRMFHVLDI